MGKLRILVDGLGQMSIGAATMHPVFGPVTVPVLGFQNREDLLEVAKQLQENIMYIYDNYEKMMKGVPHREFYPDEEPKTEVPDVFKDAFPEDGDG
jgi:transcriptional regulator of NAD metabolism